MADRSLVHAHDAATRVIGSVPVYLADGAIVWSAGLAIDADGAHRAYHPDSKSGLDHLANAGKPGRWWGVVTGSGAIDGEPIVQGPDDPAPGFYVSPTALSDPKRNRRDPLRYVDAASVPYLAVPPEIRAIGCLLGDVALVSYKGRSCAAVVADVGPRGKVGEGSPALASALGIDPSARHGGTGRGVLVVLFAGSAGKPAWPRSQEAIAGDVDMRVRAWGGVERAMGLTG